jgi:hypothetical protein
MAYEALTQAECQQDEPVTTDLLLKIKNNFDYLYSIIGSGSGGGSGGGGGGIPNGSFEIDEDGDNIPDTWTRYLYPGGSAAYDTDTPMHGAKAYRFTRAAGSNNGGGYLESDYLATSELFNGLIWVIYRCSVAGIKVMVQFRFYDKAKVEIGPPTTVFSSTSNPTTRTKILLGCVPVANARFFKVRLIGGYTDTDVAGDTFFDGTGISDFVGNLAGSGTIAEQVQVASGAWQDKGSFQVNVGTLSENCVVRLHFAGELHSMYPSTGATASQRFRVGSSYSGQGDVQNNTAYQKFYYSITLPVGTSGEQTVNQQLYIDVPADGAYGRKADHQVMIEVLVP